MTLSLPDPDAPGFMDTYAGLIENERERALADLEALVAARPESIPAWRMLMIAHHRRLDTTASAATARRLLELDPSHTDGLHFLAFAQMAGGDDEAALATYQRAHATTRSGLSGVAAALLMHRLGRLDEAAQAYQKLLTGLAPDSSEILTALRGAIGVLRDQGRVLAADRLAQMLQIRFLAKPVTVSSYLYDRSQTLAFPEWQRLADKSAFARLLRDAPRTGPDAIRVPESFEMPEEREAFLAYARQAPPGAYYIVKPARGSGGQGIRVTDDAAAAADARDAVVQRYVDRPYLVDGRKGHLRIYALITSARPLRAYIYTEGIVRFAPEPYDLSPARLADVSMHVTNTALHKGHPGLFVSQDPARDDEGAIWSVSAMLRRMAADGLDPKAVFGEISDLIAWFLRRVEAGGLFDRQAARGSARAFAPKLVGFDVLLDADAHPWLIEMQAAPASKGSPLVDRINGQLFNTIFRMSVGLLASDAISDEDLIALRRDPEAVRRAELAIETGNRGGFRRIIG